MLRSQKLARTAPIWSPERMRQALTLALTSLSILGYLAAQGPTDHRAPPLPIAGTLSAPLPLPEGVNRPWIGPEFYGNRLQDWRLRDGRVECVESQPNRPMRVLRLLTVEASPRKGRVDLAVTVQSIEPGAAPNPDSCAGFLIGTGGPHVDYRLSALVHHRPALAGGLVIGVDGTGRAVFRDFETNFQRGGWSVAGKLHDQELRVLEPTESEYTPQNEKPRAVRLHVFAAPAADGTYRVVATTDGLFGEFGTTVRRLSRITRDGVAADLVDGQIGLCSHLGPQGSKLGHAFAAIHVGGTKVDRRPERRFGPIVAVQYVRDGERVRMNAQMTALGPDDSQFAAVQLRSGETGAWETKGTATLDKDARTFLFTPTVDPSRDIAYRVVYDLAIEEGRTEQVAWEGVIRADPRPEDTVTVAAFTGNKHFTGGIQWNHDGVWFPHADLVSAVRVHQPDLLFFSGDQLYESDITGVQRRPDDTAILDYLDKWYRWCWAFGDLARDRPTICIPDDHDVYHGNIWGAGGRAAQRPDDGGYTMPARFVKMVERTQTAHLPRSWDPAPVEQGIGVYFTRVRVGGLDFAVLEDRKFKSSPTVMCEGGDCKNGWFQNPDYDPATQADVAGAKLLGDRQLAFLDRWSSDWADGVRIKAALSQTIFANVATIPAEAKSGSVLSGLPMLAPGEYPEGYKLAADADSNGWPQSGRNAALRRLRSAFAFHIAGDQHLGSFIRYGVEAHDDAGHALCVPSIANTWPRRWFPPMAGEGRADGAPRYTGRFRDGFGNRMTVLAVSNPHAYGHEPQALHDRAPGYGIVAFHADGRIEVNCWPRWADPSKPGAQQYPGWPVTVDVRDQGGTQKVQLPELRVRGNPVAQVTTRSGDHVWTRRLLSDAERLGVPSPGDYAILLRWDDGRAHTVRTSTTQTEPIIVE